MQRPHPAALALFLALAVAGCSRSSSRTDGAPEGGLLSLASETPRPVQDRPLVAEVTQLSVQPREGGAIVLATGRPATQGYWDVALVPTPRNPVDGVMTYRFVARPPEQPMPAGTPFSREVRAAAALTTYDLDAIDRIVVQGALNQRVSQR